jgi:hypothetical protein
MEEYLHSIVDLFYGHLIIIYVHFLVYLLVIWLFPPVLVSITEKNLATLLSNNQHAEIKIYHRRIKSIERNKSSAIKA